MCFNSVQGRVLVKGKAKGFTAANYHGKLRRWREAEEEKERSKQSSGDRLNRALFSAQARARLERFSSRCRFDTPDSIRDSACSQESVRDSSPSCSRTFSWREPPSPRLRSETAPASARFSRRWQASASSARDSSAHEELQPSVRSSLAGDAPEGSLRWEMAGDAVGRGACSAGLGTRRMSPLPRTERLPPSVPRDAVDPFEPRRSSLHDLPTFDLPRRTRSGFCARRSPSAARASAAESLPSTTSWSAPWSAPWSPRPPPLIPRLSSIPSMGSGSGTSSDDALRENALREETGLSLLEISLSEEPSSVRPPSPSPRSRRSSPLIHLAEHPADAPGGLDASNVLRRRSKSSPLPLRRGAAHEEEESMDPAEAYEANPWANQRPPIPPDLSTAPSESSLLGLSTAPSESSLHSSPSCSPLRRNSTSFRGMSSESSFKAASEESFSLEPRGQLRDAAASERASAEKTSPALAAVISVHSTKEFFFSRAPEGHLTYKLPVTSYGETSFSKLLAPDDVADSGIAAGNEVDAASVARMQRITLERLCRVYPSGLRVSSSNYPPLRAWRSGAQCVALNLQTNDLPTQLHHALFEGSQGYVLKPLGMRAPEPDWPPPSLTLTRVTLEILSLHGLPRPTESRPSLEGRHARCHQYEPQLSGASPQLPVQGGVSSPRVSVELQAIGGTCGLALELPARRLENVHLTRRAVDNGLNPSFDETVHCLAQEPTTTVLRVAILEGDKDVAYETCLLSSLRPGYRVLHLRSLLGTRIEACVLFVRISHGVEPNRFMRSSRSLKDFELVQALVVVSSN